MAGDQIRIEGLREFRSALRKAEQSAPAELNKALREEMDPVASEARNLESRHGQIATRWKPFASGNRHGIRNTHPGAGVFEWADRPFMRRGRAGGQHRVSPPSTAVGTPPRYGFRAAEDKLDDIGDAVLGTIEDAARAQGWL